MSASEHESAYLTRSETAAYLGVSLSIVDRWSREDDFPVLRDGRLVRMGPRAALDEWMVRKRARLAADAPPVRIPSRVRRAYG